MGHPVHYRGIDHSVHRRLFCIDIHQSKYPVESVSSTSHAVPISHRDHYTDSTPGNMDCDQPSVHDCDGYASSNLYPDSYRDYLLARSANSNTRTNSDFKGTVLWNSSIYC